MHKINKLVEQIYELNSCGKRHTTISNKDLSLLHDSEKSPSYQFIFPSLMFPDCWGSSLNMMHLQAMLSSAKWTSLYMLPIKAFFIVLDHQFIVMSKFYDSNKIIKIVPKHTEPRWTLLGMAVTYFILKIEFRMYLFYQKTILCFKLHFQTTQNLIYFNQFMTQNFPISVISLSVCVCVIYFIVTQIQRLQGNYIVNESIIAQITIV